MATVAGTASWWLQTQGDCCRHKVNVAGTTGWWLQALPTSCHNPPSAPSSVHPLSSVHTITDLRDGLLGVEVCQSGPALHGLHRARA